MRTALVTMLLASGALAQSQNRLPGSKGTRSTLARKTFVVVPQTAPATNPDTEREARTAVEAAHHEQVEAGKPAEAPNAQPAPTPGNDIYRWVDARGVIHYSTNVPPAYQGIAKKVGARSSP